MIGKPTGDWRFEKYKAMRKIHACHQLMLDWVATKIGVDAMTRIPLQHGLCGICTCDIKIWKAPDSNLSKLISTSTSSVISTIKFV